MPRRDHPLLTAVGILVLFMALVLVAPGALVTFAFELENSPSNTVRTPCVNFRMSPDPIPDVPLFTHFGCTR
jgi:hypothetical protein